MNSPVSGGSSQTPHSPHTPRTPLAQTLEYPLNQWYVAAGGPEVGRRPLGRRLLGKRIVLYRTEAGAVVAMDDWCPHRGFRFSDSRVIGDTVECGYHGMRFGPDGACTHIPSQESIPATMAVRTYPVVERRDFVWIWPGDAARCDQALLPPALEFDHAALASGFVGTLEVGANAAVAMENVIDITHASLLHPGVVDDADKRELMTTADEVENPAPTVIQTTKRFGAIEVKGYLAIQMGVPEGTVVDRIRIARQYLPGLHTSADIWRDVGDTSRIVAIRIRYVGITPQDGRACLLLAAYSGTTPYDDAACARALATLRQDIVALEATQAYLEEGGADFREVSVRADRAALMARRIIARLHAQETGAGGPRGAGVP